MPPTIRTETTDLHHLMEDDNALREMASSPRRNSLVSLFYFQHSMKERSAITLASSGTQNTRLNNCTQRDLYPQENKK